MRISIRKKIPLFFLASLPLLSSINLIAQSWVNGGNALIANGILGTTTNFSVIFKSSNAERGRLTNNGLWGFGATAPTSKVHINSAAGQDPFKVDVNGVTKLLVQNGGGVTIGSTATPPANGLFVAGNIGIGTPAPENKLHVFKGSAGTVTSAANSLLVVENSTNSYINILAPNIAETGIFFGNPLSNVSGGIIYNNTGNKNGLQFRTNGNKTGMVLTDQGNLGVGTLLPGNFVAKFTHQDFGLDIESLFTGDDWEFFTADDGSLQLYSNALFRGSFNPATGAYTILSDERLKTNIKPVGTLLEKIRELKPSTYQFKNTTDKQEYTGFIAQDVMKLFPAIVRHNTNPKRKFDIYTMDYSQFGVLAIKGIQELQTITDEQKLINEKQEQVIEDQKLKIATLEDRLAKLEATVSTITPNKNGHVPDNIANASLEQNQPNPFNKNTMIRYRVPRGSKGQINIYDQTGKMIKALNANESGRTELGGNDLAAGVYTYTLIINGSVAESKQMLITK